MNNCVSLKTFGNVNILAAIDAGYRQSIVKHNELVDKNRHALSRIIDCLKFCGYHEIAIRGHDEVAGSANCGVFLVLVTHTADLDSALRDYLDNNNVAKNTSSAIQNDLLSCMFEIYTHEITKEIKNARFICLEADETTDITCKSQFVIILCYMQNFEFCREIFYICGFGR